MHPNVAPWPLQCDQGKTGHHAVTLRPESQKTDNLGEHYGRSPAGMQSLGDNSPGRFGANFSPESPSDSYTGEEKPVILEEPRPVGCPERGMP